MHDKPGNYEAIAERGSGRRVRLRPQKNVFVEQELEPVSVVAKFATTAADGKVYQVDYYNLDVIISVGYRVKSKQGTQFRQWANRDVRYTATLNRMKRLCLSGYDRNTLIE
ncbi:hypothetical protein FACS189444_5130 [Spirochaetia bacterium]|nr:hypothetical protein FACS189444_5130 [Spirochaetia bacterium]